MVGLALADGWADGWAVVDVPPVQVGLGVLAPPPPFPVAPAEAVGDGVPLSP